MPQAKTTIPSGQNGKLPASALAPIPGGRLSKAAAAAWNAPGGPADSGLMPGGPDSSYRTYAKQVYYWNLYQSGQGNEAAKPGTSNHGWGTAVDLSEEWMRDWIDKHGAKYKWAKTEAFNEWWHVNFTGESGDFPETGSETIAEGEPEVGGAGESGISQAEAESISKGAAIAAFINLPGLLETEESLALKGERSLMNDQPLLGFVEQLCQGSLRNFMSLPNGDFYAFIPDYFGGLTGRTPYWEIDDIEILNGEIQLSDEALATHVYVVGDTGIIDQEVDLFEKMQTTGVITVFNAFLADFLNGVNAPSISENGKPTDQATQRYIEEEEKVPSLANKAKAISFLERYGARPFYEEAPYIRSHYFETFLAYQMFCLLWSKQFLTTFEFTFMPELIPGGLVAFPQHGIQCYIDEVQHSGDYESGFRTRANLSAPTAMPNGNPNVNAGMIRSDIFNPQAIHAERITAGKRGDKGQTGSKHALRK